MMCWQCPRSVRGASSARRCMVAGLRCWTSPRPRHRCPLAREAMNLAGEKGKFRWIKEWVVLNDNYWRTGTGGPGVRQVVTQWHRRKGMSWRRWRWVMPCGNFPRRYLRFLFSFLIISLCGRIIISISVCCDCDGCDRGRRDMTFGFLICPGTNRNPDQWQCAKKTLNQSMKPPALKDQGSGIVIWVQYWHNNKSPWSDREGFQVFAKILSLPTITIILMSIEMPKIRSGRVDHTKDTKRDRRRPEM